MDRFKVWIGEYGGGGTSWPWPWNPRTCSFCGGAHPQDILRLLAEGWEAGSTTKAYKWYLEVPGYHDHMDRVLSVIGTHRLPPEPRYQPAIPPVKVYSAHFSVEQFARFKWLRDRQYEKEEHCG